MAHADSTRLAAAAGWTTDHDRGHSCDRNCAYKNKYEYSQNDSGNCGRVFELGPPATNIVDKIVDTIVDTPADTIAATLAATWERSLERVRSHVCGLCFSHFRRPLKP